MKIATLNKKEKKLKESISQVYGSLKNLSLAVGFLPEANVKADDVVTEVVEVVVVQDQIADLQNALITLAQALSWTKDDVNYTNQRISNLSQNFWDYISQHADGHLPKIQGASQMIDVLKKLGMDKDYSVQPKTIYASNGLVEKFTLTFIPKK